MGLKRIARNYSACQPKDHVLRLEKRFTYLEGSKGKLATGFQNRRKVWEVSRSKDAVARVLNASCKSARPSVGVSGYATAGVAVLSALGVLLYSQAGPMFELFLGGRQPDVVALGVPVLRVVVFAMPALATITVLNGALRGAGDTRWPWVIVLLGYLLVRLPLRDVIRCSLDF